MIACAEFCPTMIGGMPLLIKTCAQEIPFDTLEDGDIIVHNDPYRGGLHCPEHTFFKPFFVDGELHGLRRLHRPYRGDRRHGARRLLRRGDRDLPRGPARAAGEDQEGRQGRRGGVEAAARQHPHAAPELWRPARHDRLRRSRRQPHRRDRQEVRQERLHRDLRGPEGLCRAAHAGGARLVPRRQVQLRGRHRERRHREQEIHRGDRHPRERRRAGGRLQPQLRPGQGADQRHARRRHRRRLQRHPPHHRSVDPEELRRLPADPRGLAAEQGDERRLSRAAGRRQHRDASAPRQHHHRRHGHLRARARDGVGELHRHQLRLRRQPSGL